MNLEDVFSFNYSSKHIDELEFIEKDLRFENFDALFALKLALKIIEESKKYEEEIALIIFDETKQLVVFQYVMNSKSSRNIELASLKRNTVCRTGHSSLWTLVEAKKESKNINKLFQNKDCLPVGGAFPIYVEEKHVATVAISGLHEGLDHDLIVKSLYNFLNKKEYTFTGKLY